MHVLKDHAIQTATEVLTVQGIRESDASTTATILVDADARGKHSHGLLRLPRFVHGIRHGTVNPDGEIQIVRDDGAAATIDGGSRLGPVVATEALERAVARADEFGIAAFGVQNSTHLGMLGYYTDEIRKRGYVGIAMTNTEPAMPPHGGAKAILGTNPIAIGIPSDPPFNLDMATSSISRGAILQARETGTTLPEGVALGPDGQPTTDPESALNGLIRPFGGIKGAGLALAIEILAGGLVGAEMGHDVTGTYHTSRPCTKGDLFIVLDPQTLGGDEFVDQVSDFLGMVKQSKDAPSSSGIRIPGESSIERAETDQIEIDTDLWDEIEGLLGNE